MIKNLFISSDIEGTCGITAWDETEPEPQQFLYEYFRTQMSKEVGAACEGAILGGVESIRVKDAHSSAQNIIPSMLPKLVTINRGWGNNPFNMINGINEGEFDAVAFTGYHSPAYSDANPLAHTTNDTIVKITLNGIRLSEFYDHCLMAAMIGIPTVFLSGDEGICEFAKELLPGIVTVTTNKGFAASVTSIHPELAVSLMKEEMSKAIANDGKGCLLKLPEKFEVEVCYTTFSKAQRMSYFPEAFRIDERTVGFKAEDYKDVMTFFHFCV